MSAAPLTITVCRRAVSEGGTLAKDIKAGAVVNSPEIGKGKVGGVHRFTSEGVPMIRLGFPAFPDFPSYQAVMPETTDVDVDQEQS